MANRILAQFRKIIWTFPSYGVRLLNSMDSTTDWKLATDILLNSKRGVTPDTGIFTQQTSATIFCKAYRQASNISERRNIISYIITRYGFSNVTNVSLSKEIDDKWLMEMTKLLKEIAPPYNQLFRAIGQLESGIKFLVDLRADVLAWIRECQDGKAEKQYASLPTLKLMNITLRDLLSIWFSIGLLEVQRVTWNSPCILLQRIAEYESVHPVRSWADLKSRVGPRRRCFVFTHPSLPSEPLVVLHVALMNRIPEKIKEVIHRGTERSSISSEEELSDVTTAIFYSINSTQAGLQGIDLGHFLIKRVVQQLSAELPSINAFSSLSPIPGFRKWLMEEIRRRSKGNSQPSPFESADEISLLEKLDEKNHWYVDEEIRKQLRPILLRSCAYYLLRVKHRGLAYDPVANFHLRNGAVVWRLNWEGDVSTKGLNQSCSLMVNYRYYPNQTDENSRLYLEKKFIQVGEEVQNFVQIFSRHSNL